MFVWVVFYVVKYIENEWLDIVGPSKRRGD